MTRSPPAHPRRSPMCDPTCRTCSRTSSFSVRQTASDVREICSRLNVDAVLEGTVRKAGDRVRISTQLVSGVDSCHLWSQGYQRQMDDVFAVQDEIARSIVERLRLT